MWFMNKIANPMVRWILRSPFYKLMDTNLLLISYRGRKTSQEYCLPVQYVQTGDHIYILPGMPEQKTWWRNLKQVAPVQLTLHGRSLAGKGVVLKPDCDNEAILEGLDLYLRRFSRLPKYHKIQINKDGSCDAEDLRLAATKTVLIRVDLSQK
jgi:hypothetical protein